ncbi:MAG: hypothetical protein OEZ13_06480 [Spirochaetia bacterium]|nr:hypothetical protein [Spirochaetia bacterium]
MSENYLSVLALFFLAISLNMPFGYFRKNSRKYSLKWFIYIHLPIPFIATARILSGFNYKIIPLLLAASVLGQIMGAKINKKN